VKWDNLILLPLAGFIIWPWATLIPAGLLALGFWRRRVSLAGIGAGLWVAYGIYESLMKARVLCSGECNIRVDLLLIIPLLWMVTIVAAVKLVRGRRNGAA
jgi:hypothetical protein